MKILPRTEFGNPILRVRAKDVPANFARTASGKRLIADMFRTMRAAEGVGLAAPQIGRSFRLAVIEFEPTPFRPKIAHGRKIVMLNPKILWRSRETAGGWEGCLSFDGVRGFVPRAKKIRVRYIDEAGQTITRELSGFPARVFQHEIDHLDGKVYIDRMTDMKKLVTVDEFIRRFLR